MQKFFNQAEMAESECTQTTVIHAAIQMATAVMQALRDADVGPPTRFYGKPKECQRDRDRADQL